MYSLEIANILYNMALDMDYADCEDTAKNEIRLLEYAIMQIQNMAGNELNNPCWITLANILERIAECNDNTRLFYKLTVDDGLL